MPRSSNPSHADLRVRATRGWSREYGEEAPYLALTAADKAELGRVAQIMDFRTAGSEAFSQGDDAAFIYLLADGVVRIYHTLDNGERQILAFHWPGDLFGLADRGKYVNSAETIASSRVYRFPVRKLERFLLKNPKIQAAFLVKAVHDLRAAQRQIIVMGRFNVPRRPRRVPGRLFGPRELLRSEQTNSDSSDEPVRYCGLSRHIGGNGDPRAGPT